METSTRVAVITGASQGIGAGLVQGYRKLGYAVVANSRTIGESDDPMVYAVAGDISTPGVGQHVIDAAMRRFGRVDTVVNNVGGTFPYRKITIGLSPASMPKQGSGFDLA